jgi:hypothetical protein
MIPEETLRMLEALSSQCDPAPWTAFIEGRDGLSFASFIQTGEGDGRGQDIYVRQDGGPANAACLDLIAAARTWLPDLISEIREARS